MPQLSQTASPSRRSPSSPPTSARAGHAVGFWLIAGAFTIAMAFSTVPTPLYPIYQAVDGFSSFVVTVAFAVYAVGVVASLLLAGHVSDWVGRRRVLLPALAIEAAAAALFLSSHALGVLLAARFVTGLGVGMITATATAHLHELHVARRGEHDRARFELVSSAANIGGLGAGPLVAGALAQWAGSPLRLPYLVFLGLLGLAGVAVVASPETVELRGEPIRYRPQRVAIAGRGRSWTTAVLGAFVAFAVFGLFTSLAPGFVGGALHHPSRLLAGAIAFVAFGAAVLGQAAGASLAGTPRFLAGAASEIVGLALVAVGMNVASLALFVVGGALAGAGAGILFKTAIGSVVASTPPAERGEALAGLFLLAYLGLVGPVLGVGIATQAVSAQTAVIGFAVLLISLITLSIALTLTSQKETA